MIKRLVLTITLAGVIGMALHAQQAPVTHQFTLQQCIDYALEHNQDILNANLEREMADRKVGETLADGLPQINANADLGYNYKIPTSFIPAIIFDPSAEPDELAAVKFSTKYTGSAGFSLTQMIFDGSYFVGLKAARTYTELSRKDQIKKEIDVVEAVTKAYYSVLVNKERLELTRQNYSRTDTLLSDTQVMYENGFSEKIDVSRVKVNHNNLKVAKQNAEHGLLISYSLLKFQMGMPIEEDLVPADSIESITFAAYESQESEGFDYENRIEYSQLQTNKDLLELDIKNTKVKYLPTIDLYGSLGANAGTNSFNDLFNFSDYWFGLGAVGLKFNVPIFDGLRKTRQIQQKQLQVNQLDNSFSQLQNSIDMEIQRSKLTMENSINNMMVQKENMKLAAEVYRVTKIKYEEGVGSNSEVLDADTALKEAQTNYYNALYDALIAKVTLQKAYGTLLKQ